MTAHESYDRVEEHLRASYIPTVNPITVQDLQAGVSSVVRQEDVATDNVIDFSQQPSLKQDLFGRTQLTYEPVIGSGGHYGADRVERPSSGRARAAAGDPSEEIKDLSELLDDAHKQDLASGLQHLAELFTDAQTRSASRSGQINGTAFTGLGHPASAEHSTEEIADLAKLDKSAHEQNVADALSALSDLFKHAGTMEPPPVVPPPVEPPPETPRDPGWPVPSPAPDLPPVPVPAPPELPPLPRPDPEPGCCDRCCCDNCGGNGGGDGGDKDPTDKIKTRDGHGDGIPLATQEEVSEAMKRVVNYGVSRDFVDKIQKSLSKQPKAFIDAFLKDQNSTIVLEQYGGGVGGTFSDDGTITFYEDSQSYITPGELVSAEFVHFWDLGTPGSAGAGFSNSPELRKAYDDAVRSGFSTGDNSLSNPVEFMMALARHVDGNSNPAIDDLFATIDDGELERAFARSLGA